MRITKKILFSFFLSIIAFCGISQAYFSERLNVGNKVNASYAFTVYKDTFFIPAMVIETGPSGYSCSLLKVAKNGALISQKRFKPANMNLDGGMDIIQKNSKFYISSVSAYTMQIHAGYYVFDQSCDTVFTKYYGDTTYWNNGCKILPYLKNNNKFLLIGITDSTCGPPHSGNYKVFVRVVDTNGVLNQTNLYLSNTISRSLYGADTTKEKGYIISGVQYYSTGFGFNYILKLDSTLALQWVINLPYTTGYISNSVASMANGDFVVAHTKNDSSSGGFFWDRAGITRLDKNGNIKWQKLYGTKQVNIAATRIRIFDNGDFVVCGAQNVKYTSSAQQIKGFIFRTDSLGNLKWWQNYIATTPVKDTIADCYLYDIIEMPSKSIAGVGCVGGSGYFATQQQSWLLNIDSMGCLMSGCSPVLTSIFNEFGLSNEVNIFPNPCSSQLTIEFENQPENFSIKIVDVVGNELQRLHKLQIKNIIDISDFSNGIYFVQIYADDNLISTRKLIKQ